MVETHSEPPRDIANMLLILIISQRTEISARAKRNAGFNQYLTVENTRDVHSHTVPLLDPIGHYFELSAIPSEIEIGIFTAFISFLTLPFM